MSLLKKKKKKKVHKRNNTRKSYSLELLQYTTCCAYQHTNITYDEYILSIIQRSLILPNFYFTEHIVLLLLLLLLVFLIKHSVSLDCVPNLSRLAFVFNSWVSCTVHGTHGHSSSFKNYFATLGFFFGKYFVEQFKGKKILISKQEYF